MTVPVFYSLSPFGVGDIKVAANITITSGVAVLSAAQTGNIGVGCCLEYNSLKAYIAPNRVGFDSGGTVELLPGTKIEDVISGATGIVRYVETTSGVWASGTAAGWIYFESTTGTFGNNNEINRTKPTVSNSIATVDGTIQGNIGNGNSQFVVKAATGGDAANQSQTTLTSLHHEYASLFAFEAGFIDSDHVNNSSLVIADVAAFACCYYDHVDYTADITALTIDIGATGINNFIHFYTPVGGAESINKQRHSGVWDANKYKFEADLGSNPGIRSKKSYVHYEGLQVYNTASGNSQAESIEQAYPNVDIVIDSCIVKAPNNGIGVKIGDSSAEVIIKNTIIYEPTGSPGTAEEGIYLQHGTTVEVYYCTVFGHDDGIENDAGAGIYTIKNCVVCNNVTDFDNVASGITYTASDDTVSGTGNIDWDNGSTDWGNVFTDYANGDFSLKDYTASGIAIIEQGTSLASSDGIWRDIAGNERDATSPDIGAFEFVPVGGEISIPVATHHYNQLRKE